MFKNVCLGGTFDGIHVGHKLLFNEALKICSHRLVVGVTDSNMITKKTLWELIAPVNERVDKVRQCLHEMNPNLVYNVMPIQDLYGPTIVEEELECIIVSEETAKGAYKINEARSQKGWNELKIHVVNLLVDSNEQKVSSSMTRKNKLGTVLRPPEPNPAIPDRPYLIGLTGGIASGKTAIGKFLESNGFGYINYDLLGHKTYANVGSPVYRKIVEHFGEGILNTSKCIDRAKLGKIVFDSREQLDRLNGMVWPAIHELVDEEISILKQKHEVIVLESALLQESGQTSRVHQIWTTIIPPEEAIKRLMNSRNLSEEEATKRIKSQTDNVKRVKNTNVLFCSLWEPSYTQEQVKRAIENLRKNYL